MKPLLEAVITSLKELDRKVLYTKLVNSNVCGYLLYSPIGAETDNLLLAAKFMVQTVFYV